MTKNLTEKQKQEKLKDIKIYRGENFEIDGSGNINYTFNDIYDKTISNKKDISKTTLNAYKMAFNILQNISALLYEFINGFN